MIKEVKNGSRIFTSVGTTVVSAKRLAEHSKNSVYITEEVRKLVLGKAKTEKVNNKIWRFKKFSKANSESDDNNKFINRFMDRNK